jgi:signal peptidase II
VSSEADESPIAEPVALMDEASPSAPVAEPSAPGRLQGPAAYTIGLTVLLADQLIKMWMLGSVFPQACSGFSSVPDPMSACSLPVGGPLHLTMVWNQGVSFGLFRGETDWVRWALAAFSLVVAGFLAVWARRVDRPLLGAAIGLIMGGAIGNLIDRVRFGAVADFIDLTALHFPWVFNIADSAITIGVILLLIDSARRDVRA